MVTAETPWFITVETDEVRDTTLVLVPDRDR